MIKKVSIKTKSNKQHVMSVESYSRWLCLVEAMTHIYEENPKKLTKAKLKANKWFKPLEKYISERYPSMLHDFKVEENLF